MTVVKAAKSKNLLTLSEVADRLLITVKRPEEKVRELLSKHRVSYITLDYRTYRVTEDQYKQLLEAMTCHSILESGAPQETGTSTGQSKSAKKGAKSKKGLQDLVQNALQKSTSRARRSASKTSSFTVLQGGQDT